LHKYRTHTCSELTKKEAVKKGPQNKSDDPFVGDWIFEYPK